MSIPILIVNFNRAEPLAKLVDWCLGLQDVGRVHIIDNASTWPPTLELYSRLEREDKATIVRRPENLSLQDIDVIAVNLGIHGSVVLSDPDLVPYPTTPNDVLLVADEMLRKYPNIRKAGPGLEVDDVPDCCFCKSWILGYEKGLFYDEAKRTPCRIGFFAPIDNTFAVYRNSTGFRKDHIAVRLDRPRVLKHVDWYEDSRNPSKEFKHYVSVAGIRASGIVLYREWQKDPARYERAVAVAVNDSHQVLRLFQELGMSR